MKGRGRQIPLVIDTDNGEEVRSDNIDQVFELHEIEAIRQASSHRFLCYACRQPVNFHATPDEAHKHGHRYHFQHPPGIDCEWKADHQTRAQVYKGVKEGCLHQDMKLLLADTLRQLGDWEVVDVDKRFVFSADRKHRGRPDLHARYKGDDVVFEVQLRSEKPETIAFRKNLYKDKGWRLVWVSANNAAIVSEQFSDDCIETKQVQKDIAFSNRGNWFIFNEMLAERSLTEGQLTLLAKCWHAELDGRRIRYDWKDFVVTLDQLTFQGGDFFYSDFHAHNRTLQATLRERGREAACEAILRGRYANWDRCLSGVKQVWPSLDATGEDMEWLYQEYARDWDRRVLLLKQKVVEFFRSRGWRDKHSKAHWVAMSRKVSHLGFGIEEGHYLPVIEKLLLILGHELSDYLCPGHKAHIRSCHYFLDGQYDSFSGYKALCEAAIEHSAYSEQINADPTILKRAPSRRVVDADRKTDLDSFFYWFVREPELPTRYQ